MSQAAIKEYSPRKTGDQITQGTSEIVELSIQHEPGK
jgi:hypothetical protein